VPLVIPILPPSSRVRLLELLFSAPPRKREAPSLRERGIVHGWKAKEAPRKGTPRDSRGYFSFRSMQKADPLIHRRLKLRVDTMSSFPLPSSGSYSLRPNKQFPVNIRLFCLRTRFSGVHSPTPIEDKIPRGLAPPLAFSHPLPRIPFFFSCSFHASTHHPQSGRLLKTPFDPPPRLSKVYMIGKILSPLSSDPALQEGEALQTLHPFALVSI